MSLRSLDIGTEQIRMERQRLGCHNLELEAVEELGPEAVAETIEELVPADIAEAGTEVELESYLASEAVVPAQTKTVCKPGLQQMYADLSPLFAVALLGLELELELELQQH